MFDDDFFMNEEDLYEENAPTNVEIAEEKILLEAKKIIDTCLENVKFHESREFTNNVFILETFVSKLATLKQLDTIEDEDEKEQLVQNVMDDIETISLETIKRKEAEENEYANCAPDIEDISDDFDW